MIYINQALRQAHDLYLDALGSHIAYVERVGEVTRTDLSEDLAELRQHRLIAEQQCRLIEARMAGEA